MNYSSVKNNSYIKLLLKLRLHYMMKTLISSFFTFLLIYIQGLEISRLPQVFFKNIKMRPKYNKKCYNHWFFCRESCNCNWQYVAWCDTRYRMCDLQPRLCFHGVFKKCEHGFVLWSFEITGGPGSVLVFIYF